MARLAAAALLAHFLLALLASQGVAVAGGGGAESCPATEDGQPDLRCSSRGNSLIQLRPSAVGKLDADTTEGEEQTPTPYTPVAIQQRMPGAGAGNSATPLTNCPYSLPNLQKFSQLPQGPGVDVVLPANASVLLDASATIRGLTIPAGSQLIFADLPNLSLSTTGISVSGALLLGAAGCPLRAGGIAITLTGNGDIGLAARSSDPLQSKGVVVYSGGVFQAVGVRFAPTWTRLAASAPPNATSIVLQDAVDWQVGQEIVVTTTALHDLPANHQNEVRTLTAVSGATLTLDRPLQFGHFGGREYQAEVALLTRTITIQGDEGSEAARYGGQTKCLQGASCQVSGVAAVRMGQENVMGRYPFHFHMMGDVAGNSFFEDCVVRRSYFRGFTIHGTSAARLSRNVAFNTSGSTYYLEDGNEERNLFEFNLAALVNIILPLADYNVSGQLGATVLTYSSRIVPTDATAVGFYCTNANNRWVGNSASGGFAGFHFPALPNVLGAGYAANPTYVPESFEFLQFEGNTAHSSGWLWNLGGCIYVGGRLYEAVKGSSDYTYVVGRADPARKAGRSILNHTKVFACTTGTVFWGTNGGNSPEFVVQHFEAHDVGKSSSALGETGMVDAIVTAHTDNTFNTDLPKSCIGFQLYDTDMRTILSGVTFRNFDRFADYCIMDLTSSNIYKPQGMFSTKSLQFLNTAWERRFRHEYNLACYTGNQDICMGNCTLCPGISGSSQLSNMIDTDGTGVGWSLGPAILGSDDAGFESVGATNAWWNLGDDCVHEYAWGLWACPTNGGRAVVSLQLFRGIQVGGPPRTSTDAIQGVLYHFGDAERRLQVGFAQSAQVTGGCCDRGWYLDIKGGAPSNLTIYIDQMPPDQGLIFSTAYPIGATLTVNRCVALYVGGPPDCKVISVGANLAAVQNSTGDVYFVDGSGRLFLKLASPATGTYFELGGVRQLRHGFRWYWGKGFRYTVTSTMSGAVGWLLPPPLGSSSAATSAWAPPTTTTFSPKPVNASCADLWGGCLASRCCKSIGIGCIRWNQWWAMCAPALSCIPGVDGDCTVLNPDNVLTTPPPTTTASTTTPTTTALTTQASTTVTTQAPPTTTAAPATTAAAPSTTTTAPPTTTAAPVTTTAATSTTKAPTTAAPTTAPAPATTTAAPVRSGFRQDIFYVPGINSTAMLAGRVPNTTRVDPIVNYTADASWTGVVTQSTYFGIVWTGQLQISVAGAYTFSLTSDDGSQLFVNGTRVVDNGGLHASVTKTGKATLPTGAVPLRLEYVQASGHAVAILAYSGPDTKGSTVVVPASAVTN